MKLLLDSHVLLWWLEDPLLITPVARRTIANPENVVFFSVASVWEISIKAGLGKLTVPPGWTEALLADGFETLVIDTAHALAVQHLPAVHHDPFDRLLIACPAQMLGELRRDLDKAAAGKVAAEFPKDFTGLSLHDLPGHFGDHIVVPDPRAGSGGR